MKLFNLLLSGFLVFILISCGSDDSDDENNVDPAATPNPPSSEEPFFVAKGFDPDGTNPSLAWSKDLDEWTLWNNGFTFNTVYDDGDELIYSKTNDLDYNIFVSANGGITETTFSPPSGLTYFNGGIHVDGTLVIYYDQVVYTSTDNGANWSTQPLVESFAGEFFYLNNEFVFFASSGNIYTSSDGTSWNVTNILFEFNKVYESNDGYYLSSINNSNVLYKTGQDYKTILDTISVIREVDSTQIDYLSQSQFLVDGNTIEAFGTFYDNDAQDDLPYKCTSTDGGTTWTFEKINLPESKTTNFNWPYDPKYAFTKNNNFYYANFMNDLILRQVPYYSTDGINWQRVTDPVLKFEYEGFYFVNTN